MAVIIVALLFFFFFNDTATTKIYTLSLHDALPIWGCCGPAGDASRRPPKCREFFRQPDRKSTRLNSSHANISYAVFCFEKKKTCSLCRLGVSRDSARGCAHTRAPLPGESSTQCSSTPALLTSQPC